MSTSRTSAHGMCYGREGVMISTTYVAAPRPEEHLRISGAPVAMEIARIRDAKEVAHRGVPGLVAGKTHVKARVGWWMRKIEGRLSQKCAVVAVDDDSE